MSIQLKHKRLYSSKYTYTNDCIAHIQMIA